MGENVNAFDAFLNHACLTKETLGRWTPLVGRFGGREVKYAENGEEKTGRVPEHVFRAYQEAHSALLQGEDSDKIQLVKDVLIPPKYTGWNPFIWVFLALRALKTKLFRNEITQGAYDLFGKGEADLHKEEICETKLQLLWSEIKTAAPKDNSTIQTIEKLITAPGGWKNHVTREQALAILNKTGFFLLNQSILDNFKKQLTQIIRYGKNIDDTYVTGIKREIETTRDKILETITTLAAEITTSITNGELTNAKENLNRAETLAKTVNKENLPALADARTAVDKLQERFNRGIEEAKQMATEIETLLHDIVNSDADMSPGGRVDQATGKEWFIKEAINTTQSAETTEVLDAALQVARTALQEAREIQQAIIENITAELRTLTETGQTLTTQIDRNSLTQEKQCEYDAFYNTLNASAEFTTVTEANIGLTAVRKASTTMEILLKTQKLAQVLILLNQAKEAANQGKFKEAHEKFLVVNEVLYIFGPNVPDAINSPLNEATMAIKDMIAKVNVQRESAATAEQAIRDIAIAIAANQWISTEAKTQIDTIKKEAQTLEYNARNQATTLTEVTNNAEAIKKMLGEIQEIETQVVEIQQVVNTVNQLNDSLNNMETALNASDKSNLNTERDKVEFGVLKIELEELEKTWEKLKEQINNSTILTQEAKDVYISSITLQIQDRHKKIEAIHIITANTPLPNKETLRKEWEKKHPNPAKSVAQSLMEKFEASAN